MSLATFPWTDRVRPVVELGVGDTRTTVGQAVWNTSRWDTAPGATWAGTEPTWLDITCETLSASCTYGRQRTTDRFVPGTANIIVHNINGWADPNATTDPSILGVRPGRAVRIGVVHQDLGYRCLFRGFVDIVTPTYDPTEVDIVSLDCVDALGEVNRAKLTPNHDSIAAGDTVDQRIGRILDRALWSAVKRDLWPTADTVIADTMGGQVADLLGQAADSGGGSVFGDLEARIAYRPRDWQTYAPGTPVDGTIGNVGMGSPPTPPTLITPGYLTATVGTVTTPDPGPLPNTYTFVVRADRNGASDETIAAQFETYGNYSWRLDVNPQPAARLFTTSDGMGGGLVASWLAYGATVDTFAVSVTQNNGAGRCITTAYQWNGTTWTAVSADDQPTAPAFDSVNVVRVGAWAPDGYTPWSGRIYSVELRTGLDPAAGTVVWRFDADDYPGTGTSYVDPRGRTWTLTNPAAITPAVWDEGSPGTAADVCPTSWERPFDRADIVTRVIIGRDITNAQQLDDAAAQLLYGIEPFERGDLLTESDARITFLGQRLLRTRGAATAPRVRSVSFDGRTADNVIDLMSTVDVYKPTRYRCRLRYPRGTVFDAEHFATGVSHTITPQAWTLDLNLDIAAPYAAVGGRWDTGRWDQSLWADAVALLTEARELIGAIT